MESVLLACDVLAMIVLVIWSVRREQIKGKGSTS